MPKSECDYCKKPCSTPNADYYEMNQIKYCSPQILFLIEHLELLRDGIYPCNPINTGYTDSIDPSIRVQPSGIAGFVTPALIYSDVSSRLKACRKDGETLEHEVRYLHADYYGLLSPSARNALLYISGWRRKRMKYYKWLKQREYRRHINQNNKMNTKRHH